MSRLKKQRLLQVLLNNMNLSLIVNIVQQLISIVGYQNTSTCSNRKQEEKHTHTHIYRYIYIYEASN